MGKSGCPGSDLSIRTGQKGQIQSREAEYNGPSDQIPSYIFNLLSN
ncbi:Uncharacterized protein dnm_061560 [Desulfonema magnum]|uniref:Uncharacterized protein n=1 Tax=Desulfonema magnum TaxID=45655 RepID=A0A975BR77_9BACT|nr:Uncharacterized protein dnm_061560 [Desulfonema magnum]